MKRILIFICLITSLSLFAQDTKLDFSAAQLDSIIAGTKKVDIPTHFNSNGDNQILDIDITTLINRIHTIFPDTRDSLSAVNDSLKVTVIDVTTNTPVYTYYIDDMVNKTDVGGIINTTAFGDLYTPVQYLVNTTPNIGDTAYLSYKLMPNDQSPTQGGAFSEVIDFDALTSPYLDSQYGKYQKFGISHTWEAGLFGNISGNASTSIGIESWGNTKRSNIKAIWEYGYKFNNKLHTEWHLEAKDTLGRSYRPITSMQPYDGSFSDVKFTADYTGFFKSPNYGSGSWEDRNFITGVENNYFDKQIYINVPSTNPVISKIANNTSGLLELLKLQANDRLNVGDYKGIQVRNSIYMQQESPEPYPTFYSSNNIFNFEGAIYQNLQNGQDQVNSITTNNTNPLEIRYNGNIYKYRVPGLRELLSIDKNNGRVGVNMDTPTEALHILGEGASLYNRKNILLGGVTSVGETSWGCNAFSYIGRNVLATGSCNGYEYTRTGFGVQGIFFEDNNIGFDVQTGGGTSGNTYTRDPKLQIFGDGKVKISNLPTYADDTAAGAGGLTSGFVYKTPTGELRIKL